MAIVAGLVGLVFPSALMHAIPFLGNFRGPRAIDLGPTAPPMAHRSL
jgi:hypothetical protein